MFCSDVNQSLKVIYLGGKFYPLTPQRYKRILTLIANDQTDADYSNKPPALQNRSLSPVQGMRRTGSFKDLKNMDDNQNIQTPSPVRSFNSASQEKTSDNISVEKYFKSLNTNSLALFDREKDFLNSYQESMPQKEINNFYSELFMDPLAERLNLMDISGFFDKTDYRLFLGVLMGLIDERSRVKVKTSSLKTRDLLDRIPKNLPEERKSEFRGFLLNEKLLLKLSSFESGSAEGLVDFFIDIFDRKDLIKEDLANFAKGLSTFVKDHLEDFDIVTLFDLYRTILENLDGGKFSKEEAVNIVNQFFFYPGLLLKFEEEQEKQISPLLISFLEKVEGLDSIEFIKAHPMQSRSSLKNEPKEKILSYIYENFLVPETLSNMSKEEKLKLFSKVADWFMQVPSLNDDDVLNLLKAFELSSENCNFDFLAHDIFRSLSPDSVNQIEIMFGLN